MTDIDIDATRHTPEVAEPGNNTFAVWFDQNGDPFLTFYREDAYASDKVRWFNADQYDTGDEDDPKSWAELCELAEGMKGPQLLVPTAKVDELTAELAAVAAAIAPTVTITPTSDAARFLHNLYQDWVKTAHKRLEQVNELTAELAKADAQLIAANRRADGLAADLSSAVQGNTALANENARLRQQRDTQADIAKTRADVITDLTEVIERLEQRANAHAVVVEAAKAWRAQFAKDPVTKGPRMAALMNAVDALPKAEATR